MYTHTCTQAVRGKKKYMGNKWKQKKARTNQAGEKLPLSPSLMVTTISNIVALFVFCGFFWRGMWGYMNRICPGNSVDSFAHRDRSDFVTWLWMNSNCRIKNCTGLPKPNGNTNWIERWHKQHSTVLCLGVHHDLKAIDLEIQLGLNDHWASLHTNKRALVSVRFLQLS